MQFQDQEALARLQQQQMQDPNDKPCPAEFATRAVLDEEESEKVGRPIFRDVDFITIYIPGDNTLRIERPVRNSDKLQYPRLWEAYKSGHAAPAVGTSIDELTFLPASLRATYKAAGVKTVEDLANMNDAAAQQFVGNHEHRRKAKAYLEAARGNAPIEAMSAELRKRDETIAALQAQMVALQEQMSKRQSKS